MGRLGRQESIYWDPEVFMPDVVWLAVVFFACVLILCFVAVYYAPSLVAGPRINDIRQRYSLTVQVGAKNFGRLVTAGVVFLAGSAFTVLVCYLFGRLAHVLQDPIDWTVFRWFEARQLDGWSRVWRVLTNVGGLRQTRWVALVGILFFPVAYGLSRRRWATPLLTLLGGVVSEYYLQSLLEAIVHRGHPPTTMGSYPSGGMARIMVIYGLFVFMTFRLWPTRNSRVRMCAWCLVILCAAVEMYARIYNLEHWATDVLGGLLFGTMLLMVMCRVFDILDRPSELATKPVSEALTRESTLRGGGRPQGSASSKS
ncbi:membrane hypothetical protein [Nostocoides japonicum T1-X7]|uniref:Phosphatidic acid phosphatase type 2/haloperoxidase domain-containing protein n=1 Tax=Nostocoides japonicum T1-X7 TaxID=1194083 RepID=A0A077M2I8_9MICO|nr:membrane hypothetical protein [Tetrasphaera japonica T1-X7]